ncbi:hypothetical protein JAU75_17550 [Ochrobactrum sp. Q0168]|uniref:hypothetical protein n=1 Tax=Ochrobactrum sp. Q0168 TaxID=2793241 RepID=UPI0018EB50FE|nr:hypothetical protein [Ochrobactrum sp. Q0168]
MVAASKLIWSIGLAAIGIVITGSAHAQFFSSGGRSGYASELFLQKVEKAGIEDNYIATVITYDNRAQKKTSDFVVNCNQYMPQVLTSDNINHSIDIKNDPSSAGKTIWELWHAVCKKDFAKISKRPPLQDNLAKVDITTEPEFNGTPYSLHYQSLDYSKNLSNMVKVDAFEARKKLFDTAYIHCDEDSATVYWKRQKLLIGVNDAVEYDLNSKIKDEELIALSKNLWNGACKTVSTNVTGQGYTPQEVSSDEGNEPEIAAPRPEAISKPSRNKTPKNAEKAISEAYETYMLTKLFCEYHYAGDRQLAPLKTKLKQLDAVAKSQKIDVDALWQKATKTSENDANYKLMQAYKAFPIEYQDRIKFSNGCEQMTRLLSAGIDRYLAESSGGKKTDTEKDF